MNDAGSHHDFDTWQAVAASGTLLDRVAAEKSRTPALLERWRNEFGAELVHIALELCEARRRLVLKWPEASGWIADRSGAEQASSALAATYKANQLRKRGVIRVTDLMCGIGGDTAAFHRAGLEAHAIDHDPFRVRCAAHNTGCAFTEQDIRNHVDDGSFVHLDPPRRDASGKRRHQWQDLLPDPAVLRELQTSVAQGVYKLSPGTDPDEPDLESCHLEWLSKKGRLTQCLAWWGEPPSDERSVVRLDDGWMFRGVPTPDLTHRGHFGAYLIRADPLLERSGLQWTYARSCSSLESVCPGLGLLTADTLPTETGLEVWEVEEVLPWREKKLKAAIRSRDGGEVVVHTRGRAVDPDQAAASLRGDGPNKIHLWCVRVGTPRLGIIVKRPT
ncbi:MAG: class I SAM-dependent methyltransferase [Planctomycetota bacterium]